MEQKCTSWSSSCQRQCRGQTPRWRGGCPPLQAPCQHWGCWNEEIMKNKQKIGPQNQPKNKQAYRQTTTDGRETTLLCHFLASIEESSMRMLQGGTINKQSDHQIEKSIRGEIRKQAEKRGSSKQANMQSNKHARK